jgi:DNA-binding NarL/FixJ family response regulator
MLVRAGLRTVVESDAAFEVVAEAADGAHALDLVARLQPRLAIIATALRGPPGIEVARGVRGRSPGSAVVLFARHEDAGSLIDGFRAGAVGFVQSDVGRLELLSTLHRTLAGESVVDSAAATTLILRLAAESDLGARSVPEPLTPRELDVLRLVARGQTNREIARGLIVAVGTIKVHVEHILGKLGATDRTQAAVRAVELGIVGPDDPEGSAAPRGELSSR